MKLHISHTLAKRPFNRKLLSLFAIISLGVVTVSLSWQLAQTPLGTVAMALCKVGLKSMPPLLWLGGFLIVCLWLVVLNWAWRQKVTVA